MAHDNAATRHPEQCGHASRFKSTPNNEIPQNSSRTMNEAAGNGAPQSPRSVEALPQNIPSIQPGGGVCMSCELAWGHVRRAYLRWLRPGYVRRMAELRRGSDIGYPHAILDPRDLKFCRNQGDLGWDAGDDPFAWRDRLPVARVGLAEITILGGGFLILAALCLWLFWPLAVVPLVLAGFVVYFFRNPRRDVPAQPGAVVSPADGRIFSIRDVDHDDYLGGPAVVIDIFLSVFNVHLNRVPMECRIMGLTYRPGKFLNALRPEAAQQNASLEVRLATTSQPVRAFRVRQITGAIARRIVCWVKPGEDLPRGGQFGMIKLGSRTELTLPREAGMEVCVRVGQNVRAGVTVMVQYSR